MYIKSSPFSEKTEIYFVILISVTENSSIISTLLHSYEGIHLVFALFKINCSLH